MERKGISLFSRAKLDSVSMFHSFPAVGSSALTLGGKSSVWSFLLPVFHFIVFLSRIVSTHTDGEDKQQNLKTEEDKHQNLKTEEDKHQNLKTEEDKHQNLKTEEWVWVYCMHVYGYTIMISMGILHVKVCYTI